MDTESFNIQNGKMSTGTTYMQQGLLHQMFFRQAKATPENVAVVEESGKEIKFRNLDENSEALGKHLVYNGVTPNACVGIYLDKSIEYTTAYIAILRAGAAYLPLDIAYPQSMLKSILEDAKPKAVITVKNLAHNLVGVTMYIISNTTIYDPPLLSQYIQNNKITQILFTPSLLEAVLNTPGLDLQQLKSLSDKNIYFHQNFYTLYDLTIDLFQDALKTRKFCPVGNILPGVNLVIMDKDQKVQPVGASGEIFVGGPTLAHGYLNRPEVQALRFIPLPKGVQTSHGDRLYRTGDWGYMLSDGRLEICGRCDSMVKIRGYSIEVQAVESALMELPMVNACVVLVEGQEGEDKFLVSYIVPEGQTTKKDIRAILKLRLPFYMIPSYFVFLQSIPMVETTGKLDKKALPNFDSEHQSDSDTIAAPNTDTEKKVAVVWCKVLKIQDVDIQDSFFDLGGHSLLATELIMNLRQMFDVDLNVRDLFTYPTITTLSQFIEAKKNKRTEELHTIPKVSINLLTEVNRHDPRGIINIDMQLRAFWRTFNLRNERRFKIGRVLLTEILLQTKCMIKCLVRELPDTTPNERLEKSLQQFGVLPSNGKPSEQQTLIQSMFAKRVEIIKGDVALINMGMNEDDYTYLCTDIDFIIHAAAYVNLVYPYEAFTGPNVTGTRNVVMFSCTGKIKPVHYISTDAVFPNGMRNCSEDDNIEDNHTELNDGYSQSKWVAEQLISRAGQKGLPVVIYRLGNMSGDRKKAFWNPQDFTLLVLQACAKYGFAPDVDWDMEMTPVDFAAEFIMGFEWMNAHGYPLKIVPFSEWKTRILEESQKNGSNGSFTANIQRLLESYLTSPDFFSNLSTYKTDNLKQTLELFNMSYPYTDSHMLKTYFKELSQRKVILPVKRQTSYSENRKLEGKIAIVTGASSGIGRAIAVALCQAGAKVALAARRMERLKEINREITDQEGICICVKTDVTKREDVKELVKHTESVFGPVDILVNNAGVMYYTMMKNLHEEEWERQIDLNCKGLTNCIGAVLDGMLKRGSGHIVNMSSDAGRKGFPGLAVYSGTKFYVEGLSQALRQEVCGSGVRVTCIQPGDVKTELITHSTDKEAQEKYDGSSSCKILEPTDIANAVLYAVTQPEYVGAMESVTKFINAAIVLPFTAGDASENQINSAYIRPHDVLANISQWAHYFADIYKDSNTRGYKLFCPMSNYSIYNCYWETVLKEIEPYLRPVEMEYFLLSMVLITELWPSKKTYSNEVNLIEADIANEYTPFESSTRGRGLLKEPMCLSSRVRTCLVVPYLIHVNFVCESMEYVAKVVNAAFVLPFTAGDASENQHTSTYIRPHDGSISGIIILSSVLVIAFLAMFGIRLVDSEVNKTKPYFTMHSCLYVTIILSIIVFIAHFIIHRVNREERSRKADAIAKLKLGFLWIFTSGSILYALAKIIRIPCKEKIVNEYRSVGCIDKNITYYNGYEGANISFHCTQILFYILQSSFIHFFIRCCFRNSWRIYYSLVLIVLANISQWAHYFSGVYKDKDKRIYNLNCSISNYSIDSCYGETVLIKIEPYLTPVEMEYFLLSMIFIAELWPSNNNNTHEVNVLESDLANEYTPFESSTNRLSRMPMCWSKSIRTFMCVGFVVILALPCYVFGYFALAESEKKAKFVNVTMKTADILIESSPLPHCINGNLTADQQHNHAQSDITQEIRLARSFLRLYPHLMMMSKL
ncbi:Uncharacterized oxidoreductase SA2266,Uncharacterized oxidoreductase MXAN_5909,Uncharacterized oxidoreductase SSP1627 [Staphylococcus saprophyticus subsp. saprophyticus ATCC 15305 _ NCTC 7292],Uncharacterized oxidoreductase Lmo0432,Uncharacterized oxidoreductase SAR2567,Uncharacterized oxidoreductase SACOL2488,Uncharacterized oxidoreductase Lin0452,Uncharacterized oxidoreductase SAS2370,Uncharacterized oxidoreductase SSP0419 [Staphylococcus saprophyticus subsp. saprophyticus ATCC 15305 _ NCTC 7292] [Mytilu|uniref:Fatty acid synthase n=1 Tax=Mytilus coruscus TaxID=42192 RepID=A0A6J8EU58_MYTCO|nr:Uncharacterized oxidoreductase SA2266,Uncharacterized oxidoreductase MXAN_5909,Uncharacterized oxidoreductase SSP1627 [Staphylococcus saprophyticus subsp. saprophyticus ATCC 15305 _ NCTC 7292],Uncharacterized oxidoreductase Lmo0432,Uncharacterized oxidoreductase SAR2567,Uncharacterized oxidoreductase SACOL2488,Uncharacterized oxidoreductase Lin0452,Uncharacterized oxidoreductase SAS2370,Uncharacterized oxidoreductase SSP0419 [Staphylococcus saprophyticus subsp. saprophyticus ATCC 15305 _ NCTC 72